MAAPVATARENPAPSVGHARLSGRRQTVQRRAGLGVDRVTVASDEMIMVPTADPGIDAALDKLKELAKLPAITQLAPATIRLVFQQ